MVLQAVADITDKDGTRLGLKNGVYIHHILVANLGHKFSLAPLLPYKSSCPTGQKPASETSGMGGMGGMGAHKSGTKPSHLRRQLGDLFKGISNFDLFVIKGNEGNSQTFSPFNTTNVKAGYWIGHDDRLSALVRSFLGFVFRRKD